MIIVTVVPLVKASGRFFMSRVEARSRGRAIIADHQTRDLTTTQGEA